MASVRATNGLTKRGRRQSRPAGRSWPLNSAFIRSALAKYIDCTTGTLSKFRAEDGKLLWRRKLVLGTHSPAHSVTVNALGVFVAGISRITLGKDGSYVRRYSHDGDIVWTVRECCIDQVGNAIDSDADGLYVAGSNGYHSRTAPPEFRRRAVVVARPGERFPGLR